METRFLTSEQRQTADHVVRRGFAGSVDRIAPEGRKKTSEGFLSPLPGLGGSFPSHPHGSRRGLPSIAAPQLQRDDKIWRNIFRCSTVELRSLRERRESNP